MPRDFTIIPKNAAAALEGNKAERKFSATLDTTLTSAATNPLYNYEEPQKSLSPASAMAIKGPFPSRGQRREQRRYAPSSENEESGQVGAAARRPAPNYSQAFRETSAKADALELKLKEARAERDSALAEVKAYKALLATVSAPTSGAASPPNVAVTKTTPNFSRTTTEKLAAAAAATLTAERERDEALETARTEAKAKEEMAEELAVAKAERESFKAKVAKRWRAELAKLEEKAKAELEAEIARVQEEMEIKLKEEQVTRLAAEEALAAAKEALAAAETRTGKREAATSSRSVSDRQQNAGLASNRKTIDSASSAQEKKESGQFRPAGRLKGEKLELTELFGAKSRVDTQAGASVRHEISSDQPLESAGSVEKKSSGSPIKAESLSAVASSESQKAILGNVWRLKNPKESSDQPFKEAVLDSGLKSLSSSTSWKRKPLEADSPAPFVEHPSAKPLSNTKGRFK